MSAPLAEQVGDALAAARHHRGLSQRALAERLGTRREVLGRVERGEENLTLARLQRLAEGYGCHVRIVVER